MSWQCLRAEIAVEFQTLAERRDEIAIATDVGIKLRRLGGFYRTVTKRKREPGTLAVCALPECSSRFVALRGGQYCSKRCRDRARRVMEPEQRRCEHPLCPKVFTARRQSHRFCSKACIQSAWRMEDGRVVRHAPSTRGPQTPKPYPRTQQQARRRAQVPAVDSLTGFARGNARKRAKQLSERPAIVCANPRCEVSFVPSYSHTLYCADICQREHHQQKLRAGRKRRWQVARERRR